MKIDFSKIRQDIPHYGDKVFLNSAGASLMPAVVAKKINSYLLEEEKLGGYFVADTKGKEIEEFYIQAASLIKAKPHNIAFAHDATDAYIKALSSIDFKKDDVVITTNDDYSSNQIQFISLQKRFGIKIFRIKNLDNGDLDIVDFQQLVEKHKPKLVAVSHIPTNSGMIQHVEEVGEICLKHKIIFLLDACQSVGQLNVDVNKIKCDFLTTTGRKFLRGPRGTGFLYVSDRMLDNKFAPLMIDGHGARWTGMDQFEMLKTAKRFQTWEASYALVLGFTEALRYANEIGTENIQSYNEKLMIHLRQNLSGVKNVEMYDKGSRKCNILTFRKSTKSLSEITKILNHNNVFYSVSSKEWGLIDFGKKGIDWAIRLSPHYFNTIKEMDKVTEIIDRM